MKIKNKLERLNDTLSKIATKKKFVNVITEDSNDCVTLTDNPKQLDRNTIFFSTNEDEKNIQILSKTEIYHMIGKSNYECEELEICLNKIETGDIWGIEKHLTDDTQIYEATINHSKDIKDIADKLLSKINVADYFDSPLNNLHLILNELVMNGFYHQEDLLDKNRKHSVLNIPNGIIVRAGADEKSIAVSVTDANGTLTRDKIVSSLKRSFEEKKPRQDTEGAGLGFYLVYQNINQLHVNIKEGKKTEIICIIDANKRFKHFKERVTSFHFYEDKL